MPKKEGQRLKDFVSDPNLIRKAILQKLKAEEDYEKVRRNNSGVPQSVLESVARAKAEADKRFEQLKNEHISRAFDPNKASDAIDKCLRQKQQKEEQKQKKEQDTISAALNAGALSNPQNLQRQLEIAQSMSKQAKQAVKNVNLNPKSRQFKQLKRIEKEAVTAANELKRVNKAAIKLRMETAAVGKSNVVSTDPHQQRMIELQKQIHATRTLLAKQTKFLKSDAGMSDGPPPPYPFHESVNRSVVVDEEEENEEDDSNEYDDHNHTLQHSHSHRSVTLSNNGVSDVIRKPGGQLQLHSTSSRSTVRLPPSHRSNLDRGSSYYLPPLHNNGNATAATAATAMYGNDGGPVSSACFTTASELLKMVPPVGSDNPIGIFASASSSSSSSSSSSVAAAASSSGSSTPSSSSCSSSFDRINAINNNNNGVIDLTGHDNIEPEGCKRTQTVSAEDNGVGMPLAKKSRVEGPYAYSSSSSSSSSTSLPLPLPSSSSSSSSAAPAMASWESSTKGIGSKLLMNMGFIPGQGLGKQEAGNNNNISPSTVQL